MRNQYFTPKQFNTMERPMQEFMELNMKTMQSFSYVNPTELMSSTKPEEFMEKNMEIFVQNGHKTLDYMQQMFLLLEKNLGTVTGTISNNTTQFMKQAESSVRHTMKESADLAERTTDKVVSGVKKATQRTMKKAQTVTKKNIHAAAKTMKKATSPVVHSPKLASKSTNSKTIPKTASTTKTKVNPKKPAIRSMNSSIKATQHATNKIEPKKAQHVMKKDNSTLEKTSPKVTVHTTSKDRDIAPH